MLMFKEIECQNCKKRDSELSETAFYYFLDFNEPYVYTCDCGQKIKVNFTNNFEANISYMGTGGVDR